ncbi:hypothetical protein [Desulfosporosinus acidiphilus]|uniref:hypothetical protein n=1 Tax=Desulfosporosinus acidiphilus TaxID=885581 RepID=UPI0013052094|nr:hypothetical protein [Desulfosporosinus acidiphilus]
MIRYPNISELVELKLNIGTSVTKVSCGQFRRKRLAKTNAIALKDGGSGSLTIG